MVYNFIGSIWKQNCGDELKVLEKTDKQDNRKNYLYRCQFLNYPCEVLALKHRILNKNIQNYLVPSVVGKGYLGIGKYNFSNYKDIYTIWHNILLRCYDIKNREYKRYGAKGITVCEEWLNFQNFAAWYEEQSKWNINNYKLEVDKDILCNINHLETKIYSPETCLLIPSELNCFLSGDNKNTGVHLRKTLKYQSYIGFNNKQIYLGTFDTFEEAKQVYAEKKQEFWLEEINKFNLLSKLKDTLKQYNFYG